MQAPENQWNKKAQDKEIMPRSQILIAAKTVWFVCSAMITFSPVKVLPQQIPSVQSSNAFETFFNGLLAAQGEGGRRGEADYFKLVDSIRR